MNATDRAVVIGIRRYADAGDASGWISNLNGPDNDADAIAAWLRQPQGGGLPPENVRVVRSADLPDPFPNDRVGPQQQAVENELNALAELPTNAFAGQYAGRRLYVYVSGHGYATRPDEAALVTAEAKRRRPLNVLVSSWVEWLYMAARFEEFVLWVDCCATRTPLSFLKPCDRDPEVSPNVAGGRRFVACAAGFNQRAVENEIDGVWHGVFTYALLQGLRGAASGEVTSDSLRDYLINNMKSFMRAEQRTNSTVAKEPAFGHIDAIRFATPAQRPTFPVRLRFAQRCIGKRATISVNRTSPLAAETVLQAAEWKPKLQTGSYVVFVPELGLYQAFSITGEGSDAVITIS